MHKASLCFKMHLKCFFCYKLAIYVSDSLRALKRKDEEIAQMEAVTEKLVNENEVLNGHVKANKYLINALQKGLESSSKLCEMLESSLHKQCQDSMKNLADAKKVNLELSEENIELKKELVDLNHYVASIQSPMDNQHQDCTEKLFEAERINKQMSDKNEHLERELAQSKKYIASVEEPLRDEIKDLIMIRSEMKDENLKLERKLADSKRNATSVEVSLQQQVQVLSQNLSDAEKMKLEMTDKNASLEREVVQSKNFVAQLQNDIQSLINKLSEADKDRLEQSVENLKLERELADSKRNAEQLVSLKCKANTVLAEFQKQIENFETSLEESEKARSELKTKNELLEEELRTWKINGIQSELCQASDNQERESIRENKPEVCFNFRIIYFDEFYIINL